VRACATIALATAAVACTGDGPVADASGTPAIVVADAPSMPRSVDAMPVVGPTQLDGILADARGTPLVLNFWASWCDPCEREVPLLAASAREHRDDVQFLGVAILDERSSAVGFLARHGVPYPNVFDPTGSTRDAVGSLGQPVTVFYGADGGIVAKVDGELSPDQLEQHLAAMTR
jgi:thiol-disulfide isomerase/thioredoxin